ncbi:N-acetyltransferase [Streptomyces sp. NPDC059456]|uniref:N-acetyltransferase n=1 Tax=Streptomyces sp. NPDC059456 TaxID=3346838 RepID=UPI0036B563D8
MIIDDGILFRRAVEKDAATLVALYDQAARWMRGQGIDQWKPGDKDAAHFLAKMREGEVWLAGDSDGRIIGAYELWWSDEEAWGVQPPVAGYVHRLMVERETAPAGGGPPPRAHPPRRHPRGGPRTN